MDLTLIVSRPPHLRWDREWHSAELRFHQGASPARLALEVHARLRPFRVTLTRRRPGEQARELTWPARLRRSS